MMKDAMEGTRGVHSDFKKEFELLIGQKVNSVGCSFADGYSLFEMHVGNKRICWEIPDDNGRCFIMNEDDVDGAGIFPL